MANSNIIDSYGIEINLSVKGVDKLDAQLKKAVLNMAHMKKNVSQAEVEKEINRIIAAYKKLHPTIKGSLDVQTHLTQAIKEFTKEYNKLHKIPPSDASKKRGMFAGFTESSFGKGLLAIRSLNMAFSEARGVWNYAEGIERVNQRLLLLSYSSSIGIGSLKDLGAAAKAFGGSAEGIASAEERRQEQMAKARRGQGFGYLQDVNWKYGFGVDFGWDANRTRQEAIRYARSNLNPEEYTAFAKEIDPANAKWMTAVMRMSEQEYKAFLEYQERLSRYSDLLTADGKKRTEETRRNTQKYEMASSELSRSWESVRDEIANALLPPLIEIINFAKKITDFLNEHPQMIKTGSIVAALAAVTAGMWKFGSAIKWFLRLLPWSKGAASAAGIAAGTAKSVAKTAGNVSKGFKWLGRIGSIGSIGSMFTGAIGDVGVGVILYRISSTVLEPWFAMWQAYALRGYVGNNDAIRNALKPTLEGMGLSASAQESFIQKWITADKMTARMAINENKLQGVIFNALKNKTAEGLTSLDPKSLANLTHAEMSFNNSSTIDNRRTQNIQNITINGAQDPQAVGEEVANAGRAIMGNVLNGTNVK